PIALVPRPESGVRRLHPVLPAIAAAAMLLFCVERGARELSALSLAQPLREPAARGNETPEAWQATSVARRGRAGTAPRRGPGEEPLWRMPCDAPLAESDATPGEPGLTAALTAEGAARRALALVPERAVNVDRLANAVGARALRLGSAALGDS